jgi:hypothetical protein
MTKKLLNYMVNLLILISLMGCGQVQIHDEVIYGNKGMLGGVSFHLLTSGQENLDFATWMKILRSKPLICTSVKSFGDVKIEIEQLCSVCNCCAADMTKAVDDFFTNISEAQKQMGGKP